MLLRRHLITLMVTSLIAGFGVTAQVPATDTDWENEFTFSYNLNRGNSDTDAFRIGAKTDRKRERDEIRLEARYDYGKADEVKNVENAYAVGDYDYVFSEDMYTNTKVEYLFDDIALIQYRIVAGPPNIGYFFIRNDTTRLSGELGVAWLWEEVDGVSNDYPALRLKQRWDHDFSESVNIFELVEYTPEIGGEGRHLLRFELGLDSALNDHLAIRIHLVNRYDSEPAEGADDNVLSMNVGLVLKV